MAGILNDCNVFERVMESISSSLGYRDALNPIYSLYRVNYQRL
mgnify:CR=1